VCVFLLQLLKLKELLRLTIAVYHSRPMRRGMYQERFLKRAVAKRCRTFNFHLKKSCFAKSLCQSVNDEGGDQISVE
jgi:hypothetical protein